jgi:hypothetical protein
MAHFALSCNKTNYDCLPAWLRHTHIRNAMSCGVAHYALKHHKINYSCLRNAGYNEDSNDTDKLASIVEEHEALELSCRITLQ